MTWSIRFIVLYSVLLLKLEDHVVVATDGDCLPNQFKCSRTGFCIKAEQVCDGSLDCYKDGNPAGHTIMQQIEALQSWSSSKPFDNSDERNCDIMPCGPSKYKCNQFPVDKPFSCRSVDEGGSSCSRTFTGTVYEKVGPRDKDYTVKKQITHAYVQCPDGRLHQNETIQTSTYHFCKDMFAQNKLSTGQRQTDCAREDSRWCVNGNCPLNICQPNSCNDNNGFILNCNKRLGHCGPDQFQCKVTSACIPGWNQCDNQHNCPGDDRSDEDNCPEAPCCDMCFKCGQTGRCIMAYQICDGMKNCFDNSDEIDCLKQPCGPSHYKCGAQCIRNEFYCPCHPHCPNGTIYTAIATRMIGVDGDKYHFDKCSIIVERDLPLPDQFSVAENVMGRLKQSYREMFGWQSSRRIFYPVSKSDEVPGLFGNWHEKLLLQTNWNFKMLACPYPWQRRCGDGTCIDFGDQVGCATDYNTGSCDKQRFRQFD